jgi:hypothetical protein
MRIARILAGVVLGLALLCVFAWAVRDAVLKKRSLGRMSDWIERFAAFPKEVSDVLASDRLKGVPDSYIEIDSGWRAIDRLAYDVFVTNSIWDQEADRWEVRQFNFRNDSVLFKWYIERHGWMMDKTERLFENAPAVHSLPGPDRTLIAKLEKTPNLMRLDRESKVLWTNHEMLYHHAIQPDPDGTSFWVCASAIPPRPGAPRISRVVKNVNGHTLPFRDDFIVRVDINSGRILYKKGVAEILLDAGKDGVLYGGSLEDPIHLNDIVPVTVPSEHWRPGDLFISIKRRSMVLLYRPSENRLMDVIEGPFISQHDVNVISDHEISVFDNRYITPYQYPLELSVPIPPGTPLDTIRSSRVVIFDFKDRSFREVFPETFLREGIHTETQGLHEILPNGDLFVEAQNMGRYYVLSPQGVIMRKAIPAPLAGHVHGPNWSRIQLTQP